MKKFYLSFLLFFGVVFTTKAQTLIPPAGELVLPQYAYAGGDNTARLHFVCRLTLTGLVPSTQYRYFVGMSSNGAVNAGSTPGLLMTIRNTATAAGFIDGIASSKAVGGTLLQNDVVAINATTYYGQFNSDATGEYTGWFSCIPNGNVTQQVVGSNVYFYVHLNNPGQYVVAKSYRTTSTIKLLDYSGTPADANGCTAVIGTSNTGSEKMVSLFDNTGFSGRPIYTTYTEDEGMNQSSAFNTWYPDVNGTPGSWGAIIPNTLSGGIKGIKFYENDFSEITLSNSPAPNTSDDGSWNGVSTASPSGGSSPITINSIAGGSLPVRLLSFNGLAVQDGIKLSWVTTQETNNQYFELNRAGNTGQFKAIAKIEGNNNSQVNNFYNFVDPAPNAGMNYYQLKQVDKDGTTTVYKTIAVKFGSVPNQIRVISSQGQELTVSITLTDAKTGNLIYTDMDGRVLYNQKASLQEGENVVRIPARNIGSRMAVVSFVSNNERLNVKVLR